MSLSAVLRRAISVLESEGRFVDLVEEMQTELDRLEGAKVRPCEVLPRCRHGKALRDHGGSLLEPPCGCRVSEAS